MIGRTNSGVGGGMSLSKPLIHANAPLGSTVEFFFGGVVVKSIPATKAFANVDGKTADYYLSIRDTGTWTVTATLGTETVSDTVIIDSNKQYNLELSYSIQLWNNGDNSAVSGGWQFSARSGSSSTRAITTTALKSNSTENYTYTFFQPKKIQTITKNTLRATITGATINSGGDNKNIAIGLTSTLRKASSGGETSDWKTIQSIGAAFNTNIYAKVTSASNTTVNLSCNVSSAIGQQYYVGLLFGNASGSCIHVWFE